MSAPNKISPVDLQMYPNPNMEVCSTVCSVYHLHCCDLITIVPGIKCTGTRRSTLPFSGTNVADCQELGVF